MYVLWDTLYYIFYLSASFWEPVEAKKQWFWKFDSIFATPEAYKDQLKPWI